MSEVNFCPYCDAPQHKLMLCKENMFFCKTCNKFFELEEVLVKCQRCKGDLKKSDFDSPTGEAVFFCVKCKRTYPASECLAKIK